MKKFFTIIVLATLWVGCEKEKAPACENWEFRDQCTPKRAGVICGGTTSIQTGRVCNEDLELAKAGRTKTVQDNADVTVVRTFIRKV